MRNILLVLSGPSGVGKGTIVNYLLEEDNTLVKSVIKGYDEAGGKGEALTIVPTLDDAQALLAQEVSPGDTVLFLNDLPDIYNV